MLKYLYVNLWNDCGTLYVKMAYKNIYGVIKR